MCLLKACGFLIILHMSTSGMPEYAESEEADHAFYKYTNINGSSHSIYKPQKRQADSQGENETFCGTGPICWGGDCIDGNYCLCKSRWKGPQCDNQGSCRGFNPCKNGGTCVLGPNDKFCMCPEGTKGNRCEFQTIVEPGTKIYYLSTRGKGGCRTRISCVPNGYCQNMYSSHQCLCKEHYTGRDCTVDKRDICKSNVCQNGGTCTNTGYGTFSCDCTGLPYSGVYCIEPSDAPICGRLTKPCINGQCVEEGRQRYSCICNPGWTGSKCQRDVNECCEDLLCSDPNLCENTLGSYRCLSEPPDHGGPPCYRGLSPIQTTPSRMASTTAAVLQSRTTRRNSCLPNLCQNGATCLDLSYAFRCKCPTAYSGNLCDERVDPCLRDDIETCENEGTCVSSGDSFRCDCSRTNYIGSRCETRMYLMACTPVNPCKNGGTCRERGSQRFQCFCTSQWQGSDCTINYNECTTDRPCRNGGRCINTDTGYNCNCQGTGFTGKDCLVQSNVCTPLSCWNGGTCQELGQGRYRCACVRGWLGPACQQDRNECVLFSELCQNGGTCINTPGGYTCQCPSSHGGNQCQLRIFVRTCRQDTCMNGGTCVNQEDSRFTCICVRGWSGPRCTYDKNECQETGRARCANNGLCTNTPGSWRCNCEDTPFQGPYCEERRHLCQQDMCDNGGTCVEEDAPDYGLRCDCGPGWIGDTCGTVGIPDIETPTCRIVKIPDLESSVVRVSVRLTDCERRSQTYDLVAAFLAALDGETNYEVESIVITATSNSNHQKFSLASSALYPNLFKGLRRLHLENIVLEKTRAEDTYATVDYPFDNLIIKGVTFQYPEVDSPGDVIGVPVYAEGQGIPHEVELTDSEDIVNVDAFLRRFNDVPVQLRINNLAIESIRGDSFHWTSEPATEIIDLSNNRLRTIDFVPAILDHLEGSMTLKRLLLNNNQIINIPAGTFRPFPPALEMLDLSNNELATIDVCAFPWYYLIRVPSLVKREINLDGNSLECTGCSNNFWIYETLYDNGSKYRWHLSPTTLLTCARSDYTFEQYIENIPACTQQIPCYGGRKVAFGHTEDGSGVLNEFYDIVISLGGSVIGLMLIAVLLAFIFCRYCSKSEDTEDGVTQDPLYQDHILEPRPQGDFFADDVYSGDPGIIDPQYAQYGQFNQYGEESTRRGTVYHEAIPQW